MLGNNPTPTIWNRYTPQSLIGNGMYGKVHKAKCKFSGQTVAIKETLSDAEGVQPTTLREIAILRQINHINVIKMIEADQCMKNLQVFIVMEYADQDLYKFMKSQQPVPLSKYHTKSFLKQLLTGVAELHKFGIIHRDLKPQNILIIAKKDDKYLVKIADFGLSRRCGPVHGSYTPETQTMLYRAPEIFMGIDMYTNSVDIWSCGCIFAEMARGEPIFQAEREIELWEDITRILGQPTPSELALLQNDLIPIGNREKSNFTDMIPTLCEKGNDLLTAMLGFTHHTRVTAKVALDFPYLSELKEQPELFLDKKDAKSTHGSIN
ncbi:kinase domain-containing protein [Globomyces pollinis-pini]|nr:kinase domain-containing protein [Globomyces pollinis-pini]